MGLVTYPTLADSICDTRSRKIKQTFFTQINTLLDWQPLSSCISLKVSSLIYNGVYFAMIFKF